MRDTRSDRMNEEFRKALSEAIRSDIKDPRVSEMCTVSRVEVTKDLKHAKVFVSVYADEDQRQASIQALQNAAGFIGHAVASYIDVRRMPSFHFELDESIAYSVHIAKVIDDIQKQRNPENRPDA